jgi:hypothetical protein
MEFYDTLDQLINPTNDLGGGPGASDASAIAKLILGGGQASMSGQKLLGAGQAPDPVQEAINRASMGGFGVKPDEALAQAVQSGQVQPSQVLDRNIGQTALAPAAAPAKPVNSNLQGVLDTADQIAGSLGSPNAMSSVIKQTLLPNPYGPGSYDPNDPDAVAQVKAAGLKAAETQKGLDYLKQLRGVAPTLGQPSRDAAENAFNLNRYKEESATYRSGQDANKDAVKGILESLGLGGENAYQKAYNTAAGKAAGENAGVGSSGDIDVAAKKLSNYEMPISALARMPANKRLAILNKAEEMSPGFDLKQYETRQKVMNSYSSGKDKDNIVRLNTAVDHLEKLKQAGDALNNTDFRLVNGVKNWLNYQGGDPKLAAYSKAVKAVSGEMSTVFKNTSGTDQEITKWEESLSTAESPRQIQANFDALVNLMRGRVDALDSNYEKAMGKSYPGGLFNPKSRAIIQKLGTIDLGSNSTEKQEAAASVPAGRVLMIGPDGREGHVPEGQLEQALKQGYKRK